MYIENSEAYREASDFLILQKLYVSLKKSENEEIL
jgi:hypothetical protein